MAKLPSNPRWPVVRYVRIEDAYVQEFDKILREAARDLSRQIAALGGGGNPITRMQLEAQRAAIKQALSLGFEEFRNIINNGQRAAASEASKIVSMYEDELLSLGISPDNLRAYVAAEAERAATGVRAMLDRQASSGRTLAESVYNTQKLANGMVDKAVNIALARGMNARDFAKYIRNLIDPNVPGGVSYAAKRLARTEINNAFHSASVARYVRSGLVDEVDWSLSSSHPEGDVCDDLVADGPYPVRSVPEKPHPFCLCFITPKLPSREDFLENLFAGKYDNAPWDGGFDPTGL